MLLATVFALTSAVLHAAWNIAVKRSGDRFVDMWALYPAAGLLFLPVLVFTGPPAGAYPWLAASTVIHTLYAIVLVRAYDTGDFTLAYPIARGGGAVVAAIGGILVLGDDVSAGAAFAMIIVGLGLMSLARPGASRAGIVWALLTAALIGTYSMIDANGARRSGGVSYGISIAMTTAATLGVVGVAAGRGRAMLDGVRARWRRHLVTGACSVGAYTLVLVAVRHAPLGYVTMLRESSVVLAAFGGWLMLREPFAVPRIASAGVIACGMALLVALR